MLMRRAAAFAKMSKMPRVFIERILVGLRWHAGEEEVFLGFPMVEVAQHKKNSKTLLLRLTTLNVTSL